MADSSLITKRFDELQQQMNALKKTSGSSGTSWYPPEEWQAWATSVLNLFEAAFTRSSVHFEAFNRIYVDQKRERDIDAAKGVFRAAKSDYDGGYIFNLERQLSAEIFGDFVALAKEALANGNHAAATVLASAALEDALKRYASSKGFDVAGKTMQDVIALLKSKGLVAGAQKSLLDTMPKVRNQAMHADWSKLTAADAGSVIGFVEHFLLTNF